MKKSEFFLMIFQLPVDFLFLMAAAASAYFLRFTSWFVKWKPVSFDLTFGDFLSAGFLVAVIWIFFFALAGLYSMDQNRKLGPDLVKIFLACSAGLSAVAVYFLFSQTVFDSRFLILMGWFLALIYVSLGRLLTRGLKGLLYRMKIGLREVVIVGSGKETEALIRNLKARPELGYNVAGSFDSFSSSAQNRILNLRPDEIIFLNSQADRKELLSALTFCDANQISFKYSADIFATFSSNMVISPLAGFSLVELKKTPLDGWGSVVKRIFDIVLSSVLLVLLAPLMLLIALGILVESGGPVIYRNERVGRGGKKFFTLKFRSMRKENCTGPQFGRQGKKAEIEEKKLIEKLSIKEGPLYKIADDPRVTPFGRFLRRWSWDELPQFFNVLAGNMSIVGPRPHQPREVERYEPYHKKLLTIKPGITGLAQISGRSDLSFEEEFNLDALYLGRWSLFLDIIIFIKTPFILFRRRKAL